MGEISLIEAWGLWVESDSSLPQRILWGMEVHWWGRLGKLVQFIAACTIILEIIGAKSIGDFGADLKRLSLHIKVRDLSVFIFEKINYYLAYNNERFAGKSVSRSEKIRARIITIPFILFFAVIGFWLFFDYESSDLWSFHIVGKLLSPLTIEPDHILVSVFWILIHSIVIVIDLLLNYVYWTFKILCAALLGGLSVFLVIGLFSFLISLFFYIITLVLIEPTAKLLENKSILLITKIISVALLIFGFHFDYLAS